jgi:hypothetical protein
VTSCACAGTFLLLCGCATSGRIPADHATTSLPIVLPPADLSDVLAPVEIPQRFFSAGGFVCLDASGDAEVDVTHDGSQDLPAWAQRATVFLNGWRLSYLSKDHHVNGLYAEITNVRRAGTALRWRAHGRIFDRNDDDAYRFCYSYTAIAWNPGSSTHESRGLATPTWCLEVVSICRRSARLPSMSRRPFLKTPRLRSCHAASASHSSSTDSSAAGQTSTSFKSRSAEIAPTR